MSFAYKTPVVGPGGTEEIQDFMVGDEVLAGSPSGTNRLDWSPYRVRFSSGSAPGSPEGMMFIKLAEARAIICDHNQYFLLPSGKIKQAGRLVASADTLTGVDGKPLAIVSISIGRFTGGVHAIATDAPFKGGLNGHLLIAGGVVVGDYFVEMYAADLRKAGLVEE